MNKKKWMEALAEEHQLSQTKATNLIDSVFEHIVRSLERGETARLRGFGTFTISDRAQGNRRHPKTGELITLPAQRAVLFRPGKELRRRVAASALQPITIKIKTKSRAKKPPAVEAVAVKEPLAPQVDPTPKADPTWEQHLFHIRGLRDNTTYLWRKLSALKAGESALVCRIREVSHRFIAEDLHVLQEAGYFACETSDDDPSGLGEVLNLRMWDISARFKKIIAQVSKEVDNSLK